MIGIVKRAAGSLAITLTFACAPAAAASSPMGIWVDHTGRGAVEITDCGGKLCGRIVWVKDRSHNDGCNFQVIGNVRPVGGNKWDGGWIIDPDKNPNQKYDVEITPLSDQKLKVMGYMGTKFFSETMTWTRAPADLKKCGDDVVKAPVVEPSKEETPRREAERPNAEPPVTTPNAAPERKPEKTASRQKDCKMNFGGISVTYPCDILK